jgi:threonine dehydrogenase-like Zn-dependent dehydrogenase
LKAAILKEAKHFTIEERPIPTIGPKEALIKISVCGVCASEIHDFCESEVGSDKFLGHEAVGVIEQIGEAITQFKVGDRVTGVIMESFAEYGKAEEELLTLVPDSLSDNEAIGEPLGCLMSGANRTPVEYGQKVAVIGLGYMGLGFLQLMKMKNPVKLIGIDIREEARQKALVLGADEVYHPADIPNDYKIIEFGRHEGEGFDVVAETTGTQPGLDLAGELTAVHGLMSIVGFHQGDKRAVDMCMWNWKAFTVVNAHERHLERLVKGSATALQLIEAGKLNTQTLMTHEFSLADIDQAFNALLAKPEGFIKAVVRM